MGTPVRFTAKNTMKMNMTVIVMAMLSIVWMEEEKTATATPVRFTAKNTMMKMNMTVIVMAMLSIVWMEEERIATATPVRFTAKNMIMNLKIMMNLKVQQVLNLVLMMVVLEQ